MPRLWQRLRRRMRQLRMRLRRCKAASARAEAACALEISIAVAAQSASAMHPLRQRQKQACNDGAFYSMFEAASCRAATRPWRDGRGSWCWWWAGSGHVKHAALAFESAWQKPHSSRHVSRAWQALGFGKWCGTTSVRVRLEALCLLLEHGVWVREPLSVRVLCEGCAVRGRRGNCSRRACASARLNRERVLGWQVTRLAVVKTAPNDLVVPQSGW